MTTVLNIPAKDHECPELSARLAECTAELLKGVHTRAIRLVIKANSEQAPLLFSMRELDNGDIVFVAHMEPLEAIAHD